MTDMIPFSQENLQTALQRLREEHKKAEKLEADIKEDRISWKAGDAERNLSLWS